MTSSIFLSASLPTICKKFFYQNYFQYDVTWYPVPAGSFAITAKAIDDKGRGNYI